MKTQFGFTLVELMVVVVIIGIILSMVSLNFTRMNQKHTVESYTKEIHSILMRARNNATNTNTMHRVEIAANLVQSGPDATGDGFDEVPDTRTFRGFTLNFNNPVILFDRRGLANNAQTINITGFPANTTPALDCIVIAFTRINIGRLRGPNDCAQR